MRTHAYEREWKSAVSLTVLDNLGLQSSPATTTATVGCTSPQAVPVIWGNGSGAGVKIGRATRRERVGRGVAGASLKKKTMCNRSAGVDAIEHVDHRMLRHCR